MDQKDDSSHESRLSHDWDGLLAMATGKQKKN